MTETARPIIQIQNVSKRFGKVTAVDNVSLDINAGEFFVLLGPSGCGKTTLLRMIAGFELPTEGKILIDGQDVTGVPPNKRPVNMVFQSYAVFPHMSVADNVAYGLKIAGVKGGEVKDRVAEALELVKLGGFETRMPDQMSGGQRQRVALARSLVMRPKVLLLDEPLSALDAKLRAQMQFELSDLQEKVGITFVTVTHDQDEALSMACRIGVINKGDVAQLATPSDLYEYPANRFVAGKLLEMFGCTAEMVENGCEAVAAVAARPFDLVLMDIKMPVMDGVQATRAIRALPAPAGALPILALTANADERDERDYVAAGMNGVAQKPIQPDALLNAIRLVMTAAETNLSHAA